MRVCRTRYPHVVLCGVLMVGACAALCVAACAWAVRSHQRRVRDRRRAVVQTHLDHIAAELCASLAAGEGRRHAALCARYERLGTEFAGARSLAALRRVEHSARMDALTWRVRARVIDTVGPDAERQLAGLAREGAALARSWWAMRTVRAAR